MFSAGRLHQDYNVRTLSNNGKVIIRDNKIVLDSICFDGSNIEIGNHTLENNTTGGCNIAVGKKALQENTTGSQNVAVGCFALQNNTTGTENTGVGNSAGRSITTGSGNTIIGAGADADATNNNVTIVGQDSVTVSTGDTIVGQGISSLADDAVIVGRGASAGAAGAESVILGAGATSNVNKGLAIGAGATVTTSNRAIALQVNPDCYTAGNRLDCTINGNNESIPLGSYTPPIRGWIAFWWNNFNNSNKHKWAMYDPITGIKLGNEIGYAMAENRDASPPNKSQFKKGATPTEIAFLLTGDISGIRYMLRHDVDAKTYLNTVLGPNPLNHSDVEIMTYDAVNTRYIGMAPISSQSYKYGVVVIDENTGVITPLTGEFGTLPPTNNQALDMEIIGNRIFYFERYDDTSAKGHVISYDRDTGQYLTHSFLAGNIIPYPGTFVQTFLLDPFSKLWYQSVGYDAQNFRLHLVLSVTGGGYDRNFAWIQATSEADMISKLESGNYDVYLTQNQPTEVINAALWIDP